MRIGFAKEDITPRVGVELCGFGAYINRTSIAVRDRLWARAMAVEIGDRRCIIVSCDLIGVSRHLTTRVRRIVGEQTGLPPECLMVHCTHTHSGPNTGGYIGWGAADQPYIEVLPGLIAQACLRAHGSLREATLSHAVARCEGVARNREYDTEGWPEPLEQILADGWRPRKPELTDTTCHVIRADADGRLLGFLSHFGCHPVCCCEQTHYIHGDFPGVATNMIEREHPGAVGLFLQGAQGDINTCVAHQNEQDSLLALDIISARFANAVRDGLTRARPFEVQDMSCVRHEAVFSRKPWTAEMLRAQLAGHEAVLHRVGARDTDKGLRMATVHAVALRRMISAMEAGEPVQSPVELQGIRLGPISFLGTPFEIFRAIRDEACAGAKSAIPLVMGITNDTVSYAPDRSAAARGGYAADTVPLICGMLPFANIHDELVKELQRLDAALA
jgi:hypothetical protein